MRVNDLLLVLGLVLAGIESLFPDLKLIPGMVIHCLNPNVLFNSLSDALYAARHVRVCADQKSEACFTVLSVCICTRVLFTYSLHIFQHLNINTRAVGKKELPYRLMICVNMLSD